MTGTCPQHVPIDGIQVSHLHTLSVLLLLNNSCSPVGIFVLIVYILRD